MTGSSGGGGGTLPLPVFLWNGVDYLHKLCNDLDFLSACEPLLTSLCISPAVLRANPFMQPSNLADRAVALAGTGPASEGMVLSQAEAVLLSTSLLPTVRALAAGPRLAWDRDSSGGGSDDGAARLSKRAEDRLAAAEVVVLHHLAKKSGDSGLGDRLESRPNPAGSGSGSQISFRDNGSLELSAMSIRDSPTSRAPLGLLTTDPLRAEDSTDSPEFHSLLDDSLASAPHLQPQSGARAPSRREPKLQSQGRVPVHDSPSLESTLAAARVHVSDPAPSFAPKAGAHSLKKASSIYTDSTDIEQAKQRRQVARERAAAASVAAGAVVPAANPRASTTTGSISRVRAQVEASAGEGGVQAEGGTASKIAPARGNSTTGAPAARSHARGKPAAAAEAPVAEAAAVALVPKKKRKPKRAKQPAAVVVAGAGGEGGEGSDPAAAFDPTGLKDASIVLPSVAPSAEDGEAEGAGALDTAEGTGSVPEIASPGALSPAQAGGAASAPSTAPASALPVATEAAAPAPVVAPMHRLACVVDGVRLLVSACWPSSGAVNVTALQVRSGASGCVTVDSGVCAGLSELPALLRVQQSEGVLDVRLR